MKQLIKELFLVIILSLSIVACDSGNGENSTQVADTTNETVDDSTESEGESEQNDNSEDSSETTEPTDEIVDDNAENEGESEQSDSGESSTETSDAVVVPERSEWVLDTSNNTADLSYAIDDDESTRWTTNEYQNSEQWLIIDFGVTARFSEIKLDTEASNNDYPRGYTIYISDDGIDWGEGIASGIGNDTTRISFDEVEARYIKIDQTGSSDDSWWSIYELYVESEEEYMITATEDCIQISSLSELLEYTDESNVCVQLASGTYEFNTDNVGEDGQLFGDSVLLLFTGDNNSFFFDDVKFEYDTDIFRQFGSVEVLQFQVVGENNRFYNLTMEDIGDTVPYKTALAISMDGADNLIDGFHVTTRGSYPYGYGDIFGKGSGSVIGHKKHGAVQFRGDRNHLKDSEFYLRSYGHGIFIQGAEDALIEGVYVEGELSDVATVLAEEGTGSAADEVDFLTVWGFYLTDVEDNYRFSLQEDGIRAYSTGLIYGTEESRDTGNITVIDSTVKYMRSGVTLGWAKGNVYVENCTALGTESGFWVGSSQDIVNSRGDTSVGPLYSEDREGSNSDIELTIVDNVIEKIGNTPSFYLAGSGHEIVIYDDTEEFDSEIEIQVGGTRYAHRWLTGSDEEPPYYDASNLSVTNNSDYPIWLGENSEGNAVFSCAVVQDDGSSNTVSCNN